MSDKESRIQKERKVEAIKNNLMGAAGRLGTIVKNLGQPVVRQISGDLGIMGGVGLDCSFVENPYVEPPDMPTVWSDIWGDSLGQPGLDDDTERVTEQVIGWHFDGLKRGMHLEINYMELDSTLSVRYKGYLVYEEIANELTAYVPLKEWEDMITKLHVLAKKRDKEIKKTSQKEDLLLAERAKKTWLQRVRERWGFSV